MTLTEKLFGVLTIQCIENPQTTVEDMLRSLEECRYQITEAIIEQAQLGRDRKK